MKSLQKWAFRMLIAALFSFGLLVGLVFNPALLYAEKTIIGKYTIHHEQPLPSHFAMRLAAADEIIQKSDWYDPEFEMNICLNDGSPYPAIIEKLRGPAFGWGFSNIAVYRGNADFEANTVEIRGYKWKLEQLFAHELTHLIQHHELGFWDSNPLAGHPTWIWEGYPEYIARNKGTDLKESVSRLIQAKEQVEDAWEIDLDDGTMAPRSYFQYGLLVQFAMEVRGMTYHELLADPISMATIKEDLMVWYTNQ